jgi:hypothetical protein
MKLKTALLHVLLLVSVTNLCSPARAAITGQWDFKASNLAATIGQDLSYLDSDTQARTAFGSTTSFAIPDIGGQPTNVMKFPKANSEFGGYYAIAGAVANGGGSSVNQYTLIMDVLFPTNSSGAVRALAVTDQGGEFLVDANNGLSFAGGFAAGSLTPNAWHRVAFAVDTTNTISMFIDGIKVGEQPTPLGLDGKYSISGGFNLFDDASTNSQSGFLASLQFQDEKLPDGLIGALGAPVASGILTGPPPNPYVVSETPTSDLRFPNRSTVPPNPMIQVVLHDGTTTVDTNTIQLKLNGVTLPASVVRAAPDTTIAYRVTNFLAAASSNVVALTYQDSAAHPLGAQFAFFVGPYIALPASAAAPAGSANTRGFIFRVAQAPAEASLANSFVRAQQQLDGTLLNTNGVAFTNEAALSGPGSQPDGSFFIDQFEANNGTVVFDLLGNPFGHLPALTTFNFPGIPGLNGSTDNFADETLAYLQLTAGSYTFGVNVGIGRVDDPPGADDGYMLFCGANPRDQFAALVGQFVRTGSNFGDTQNTNEFTFVVPADGIYPFRLVHWQTHQTSDLGWYYVDATTGARVLINDPSGSIPAYRVSTLKREPYVAEVYPVPGGSGFPASAPVQIVLSDDDLQVATNSIQLTFNGALVSPSVTKSGKLTTILYNPNASRSTITNTVQLVYNDNSAAPAHLTNNWSFTIVAGGGAVADIAGQWDFNSGDLRATIGKDLQYFDGPSGSTAGATAFGTCSSFGIPTLGGVDAKVMKVPGGAGVNGNNNFGYVMDHQISPNGGGQLVNQYTIIWDMYYAGGTLPFFNCQNTNNAPADGSLFLQNGQMGQGTGGYVMKRDIATGWHRLAFAVDLSQNLITKWVDGTKQQDWISSANALDAARRAWQHTVLLFADGDGDDHDATVYVKSIQVRNGRLNDAQMAALGGPSPTAIPQGLPPTHVTGQWDFDFGDLSATVGKDLQYFDGTSGSTAGATAFGTCSSFGIPTIRGIDAKVMKVPGGAGVNGNNNFGYIMDHQISPNGGGTLVNQYTIIWDMYYAGGTLPFFNCQNTNNAPADGSLFLQNGQMGQGSGGYVMKHDISTGWHRIAFAVDLSQNLISKWVDGVKQQDWVSSANALDTARRAWQHSVLLFADGDGDDHDATVYVKSIQVSEGKLSDAQMVALAGPDGNSIPIAAPATSVTGQWDFNSGDLSATVGKDLQYFDGTAGSTASSTAFGTCSSFSIPLINGVDAQIIKVPGGAGVNGNNNFGYIMDHQISPNGGGKLVNQYTIVWDMYYAGGTLPFFNCQNTNNAPADGSLFLQNGQMGQGSGGYVMLQDIATGWHRIAFAVDLSQNLITKWVDGVKQQDWVSPANALDAARRAWQHTVLLFADGDGDDHDATVYLDSIQVSVGKLSDAAMTALGTASGNGIPVVIPTSATPAAASLTISLSGANIIVAWPPSVSGLTLKSSPSLNAPNWQAVPGVANNSVTLPAGTNSEFFALFH